MHVLPELDIPASDDPITRATVAAWLERQARESPVIISPELADYCAKALRPRSQAGPSYTSDNTSA